MIVARSASRDAERRMIQKLKVARSLYTKPTAVTAAICPLTLVVETCKWFEGEVIGLKKGI